jgi:tyrosine-protein kinase Etk/Wzc
MSYTGSAPARQPVPGLPEHDLPVAPGPEETLSDSGNSVAYLRPLWEHRRLLACVVLYGFLASTLVAFLIPARYESTARLMPPDRSQTGGLAMAAAALSGGAAGLGGIASQMLGLKSTSDIFVGILSSRTVQDKLIQEFDLKKRYGDRRMEDARKDLAKGTDITVDRKSQIITLAVTDHDPKRAVAMGEAYVEELNRLLGIEHVRSGEDDRTVLK